MLRIKHQCSLYVYPILLSTAYVQACVTCKLKEPQWLNNVAHTSFAPKDARTTQQGMPHMQPLRSKQ